MPYGASSRCPAPHEADLRGLGRDVGRPPRRWEVDDFGADLDDSAPAPLAHAWNDGPSEENRALHEEVQLRQVVLPRDVLERSLRLRPGGVHDEHVDGPELALDRRDEAGDLRLIGDVAGECFRFPTFSADLRDGFLSGAVGLHPVDGHREPVTGQPESDTATQSTRAPRDERHPPVHRASISLPAERSAFIGQSAIRGRILEARRGSNPRPSRAARAGGLRSKSAAGAAREAARTTARPSDLGSTRSNARSHHARVSASKRGAR
jgi:hypothetical protein